MAGASPLQGARSGGTLGVPWGYLTWGYVICERRAHMVLGWRAGGTCIFSAGLENSYTFCYCFCFCVLRLWFKFSPEDVVYLYFVRLTYFQFSSVLPSTVVRSWRVVPASRGSGVRRFFLSRRAVRRKNLRFLGAEFTLFWRFHLSHRALRIIYVKP